VYRINKLTKRPRPNKRAVKPLTIIIIIIIIIHNHSHRAAFILMGGYDELLMWLRCVGCEECLQNFDEETTCKRPIGRCKWRLENNIRKKLGKQSERVRVVWKRARVPVFVALKPRALLHEKFNSSRDFPCLIVFINISSHRTIQTTALK
jgi:hypothetical protein